MELKILVRMFCERNDYFLVFSQSEIDLCSNKLFSSFYEVYKYLTFNKLMHSGQQMLKGTTNILSAIFILLIKMCIYI